MYVVPLKGDTITTTEGTQYEVLSFTNFKSKGPAVYCTMPGLATADATPVVYFFDIVRIRDVHVEYDASSKVFRASGKVKRNFHLPQPGDKITILKDDTPMDAPNDEIKVEKLKLHSKTEGIAKGLLVCSDRECFRLNDIIAIDRQIGSDSFNRKRFLKIYSDYAGNK